MTLREQRTPRKRALIFTGLVGACLVLLALGRTEPAQELRRGVHFAVSPIQAALAGGTRSITAVLGAFTEIEGARVKVLDAAPVTSVPATEVPTLAPGELRLVDRRVLVGTGDGALELRRVQPAGRTAMPAADWWRGLGADRAEAR